jgi:hypothetical protein
MLLVRRFAPLTAGCGEDGRANNRRTVAHSLCGGSPSWPLVAAKVEGRVTAGRLHAPCATICLLRASGQLVRHVRPGPHVIEWEPWCASGETLPVTLRARAGKSAFKKKFILRAVAMPRSSCFHHALLPSGPLDGALWCPLGGSASGPSP